MVANISSGLAGALSLLWLISICICSSRWISSQSTLVSFRASLLTVYISKGDATSIASWLGSLMAPQSVKQFDTILEKSLWYEDALSTFCSSGLDAAFRWCSNWTLVVYSSWFMFVMGFFTSALLMTGGGFMYYYASVKATATGRTVCRTSFALAPCFAMVGLIVYTCCTLEFGTASGVAGIGKAQKHLGLAYWWAWVLALLSILPLYLMLVFLRVDPLEKKSGERWEEDGGAYPGGTQLTSYPSAEGQQYAGGGYPQQGAGYPQQGAQPQGGFGMAAPGAYVVTAAYTATAPYIAPSPYAAPGTCAGPGTAAPGTYAGPAYAASGAYAAPPPSGGFGQSPAW